MNGKALANNSIKDRTIKNSMENRMEGMVIFQNIAHQPAPSIFAAS
jgi:hypothetical protein